MALAIDLLKFPLNEVANDRADFNDHYDIRIDALKNTLKSLLQLIDVGGLPPGVGPVKSPITTVFSGPVKGELGYISSDSQLSRALATALSTSRVVGAYDSAGQMSVGGTFPVFFKPGLTPVAGNVVYLSDSLSGAATNVQPVTSGHYIVVLGILEDAGNYNSGTGSALPVIWQPSLPVLI